MKKLAVKSQFPSRLYKYRAFSEQSIASLVDDKVYLASPATFNDPMDTRPVVTNDVDLSVLEDLVGQLTLRRAKAEMQRAAKTIRYRGPKTIVQIERLGRSQVQKTLAEIAYSATDPEFDNEAEAKEFLLVNALQRELLLKYDSGMLCLASRVICPLMWSHYGDQHKGFCVGYAPIEGCAVNLHKVQYGGSRLIEVSVIARMLAGDTAAKQQVDDAVLLRKALDWRYEREWRLVGDRGLQDSPFELVDVTFGFRCSSAVKWAVVAALANRSKPVAFYEIREMHGTFRLKRLPLDTGELGVSYPRRARDVHDDLALYGDDADSPQS